MVQEVHTACNASSDIISYCALQARDGLMAPRRSSPDSSSEKMSLLGSRLPDIQLTGTDVLLRRVPRRPLALGMQGSKKAHQRSHFCRRQIFSVSRHVSASLQHLADELVIGKPCRHVVQCGSALYTHPADHVAVPALLLLKHNLPLSAQRGGRMHIAGRNRVSAPRQHLRTPRRVGSQVLAHRKAN